VKKGVWSVARTRAELPRLGAQCPRRDVTARCEWIARLSWIFSCQSEHYSKNVANLVRNMVTMVGMVITVRPCVTRA